jgi:surface antigen
MCQERLTVMARDDHRSGLRHWTTAATALGLALSVSACAVSFPVPGFVDSDATGSIKAKSAEFSADLDKEDWRRANAALAVALDPQGNGAEAAWHNPQSGARGSFAALAPPFVEHDRICRAFKARVAAHPGRERRLDGSACRARDGDWVLAEIKQVQGSAEKRSK